MPAWRSRVGTRADGSVALRRTLGRVLRFLKQQPKCAVMRQFAQAGRSRSHGVRPPVKPQRQKNDAADADAGAASRPTMRFVAVKEQQGWRSLFVRQRTALRGHLAEFGLVAPQGTANVRKLEEALLASPDLPDLVHQIAAVEQGLNEKIGKKGSRRLQGRTRTRSAWESVP